METRVPGEHIETDASDTEVVTSTPVFCITRLGAFQAADITGWRESSRPVRERES
jgi:hypothetical protein